MVENKPYDNIVDVNGAINENWYRWFDLLTNQANYGTSPSTGQELSAGDQVQINSTMVRVEGASVGTTTLTSDPQFNSGSGVLDGQTVTIEGTSNDNMLELVDGNGLQLNASTNFTLGQGDTITLHYNSDRDIWVEDYRSTNNT